MAPFVDFDQFLAQDAPEPVRFKYKGKTYTAPGAIPMSAFLSATALSLDSEDPGESVGRLGQIMAMVLGAENWERLLADDIDLRATQAILQYVMGEVSKTMGGEDGEADPTTMAAEKQSPSRPPTSSATGDLSRETSGGFSLSMPGSS